MSDTLRADRVGAETLLAVEKVGKKFDAPDGTLTVLEGLDLKLSDSEICFILGRSGAGKSTLLHLLGGLDRPSSGRVLFRGENIFQYSDRALSRFRNEHVGFVFQFYHLLPELTVFENVVLPARILGKKMNASLGWATELLVAVGLESRAKHHPRALSGGEQQRAAIARALMNKPELVLCDEPTGNLDKATAELIMELVMRLSRNFGQSFCIVTHEESFLHYGARAYRLEDGRLQLLS